MKILQHVAEAATALVKHGFTVYMAKSGTHGFYTDGFRCVSFQDYYGMIAYSGNYAASRECGTGWRITDGGEGILSAEKADRYIKADAPRWATGGRVMQYTTPEQYLKTYGKSSGFYQWFDGLPCNNDFRVLCRKSGSIGAFDWEVFRASSKQHAAHLASVAGYEYNAVEEVK